MARPDLDSRPRIEAFVDQFYDRLLKDPLMAPIFFEVAEIDLSVHLPHIKDYWCKLLLGEQGYQRHTMNIHRRLHARRPLEEADFKRWLSHFETALDAGYAGPNAERARRLARSIAANMQKGLHYPI